MKKYLLSLLCLMAMTLSLSAASVEKSYKLEFSTGSNVNGTNISTSTAVSSQMSSGKEYVTGNFTTATKAAGMSTFGLKLGTTDNSGTVAFDLSEAGCVKIKEIIINGAHYNNTKDAEMYFDVYIDDASVGHIGGFKQNELSEQKLTLLNSVAATKLKFMTGNENGTGDNKYQARGYIKDLTIVYEEETGSAVDPDYKNIPQNFTMTIGDKVAFPVIEPASLEYTFSVEPEDLLAFDELTKTITANKIGEGTVTFTTKEVEGTYNAASGTFPVKVVGKISKISFANQVVIGKMGTGVVWQIADVIVPEGVAGDGELVTYESSDPSIVSINEDTGRIKQLDLHKTGEVIITATFTPNEEYKDYAPASDTYKIIVKDPAVSIEPGYSIFDFTTENPYGMTTLSGNAANNYEKDQDDPVTEIVGTEEVVTISFDGNYRAWKNGEDYHLRVQSGGKMKFEVPEGYKITKIGFVTNSNWNITFNPASKNTGSGDASSDELTNDFNHVWMPKAEDEPVSSVEISNTTSRSEIKMIEVLFEAAESDLKSADLSFTKNVYGMIIDEPAKINLVNNPEGREITYTIVDDNLSEDDYKIEFAEDGMLEVTISKTGSYTLRATSAAGDGYRDGLAIMRLNVYRHVTVYKDNEELTEEHIKSIDGCYITMDVHPSLNLYYKLEETPAQTEAKVSVKATDDEEEVDENLEEGFTKYEDGIEIPENHEGKLHFYLANYGYKSPVRTMTVAPRDTPTGVEEIVVANGPVKYFDLNGRVVNGKLDKGVYVRVQDGKATKVLVK